MATSMPKAEKHYAEGKRAVVRLTVPVGYLLDLVSRYRAQTKKSLHEEIWRAGFVAMFGVDPDEVETPSPLPRGSTVPKDNKELVEDLLRA